MSLTDGVFGERADAVSGRVELDLEGIVAKHLTDGHKRSSRCKGPHGDTRAGDGGPLFQRSDGLRDYTVTTTLPDVTDGSKNTNVKRAGRDRMHELIFALAILTPTVALAEYNCGASTCICTGSVECQVMRNSAKCGGKVACHTSSRNQLICTCRRQDLKNSHIEAR